MAGNACPANWTSLGADVCARCPPLQPHLSVAQVQQMALNESPFSPGGAQPNPARHLAEQSARNVGKSYCGGVPHIRKWTLYGACYNYPGSVHRGYQNPYGYATLGDGAKCFMVGRTVGSIAGNGGPGGGGGVPPPPPPPGPGGPVPPPPPPPPPGPGGPVPPPPPPPGPGARGPVPPPPRPGGAGGRPGGGPVMPPSPPGPLRPGSAGSRQGSLGDDDGGGGGGMDFGDDDGGASVRSGSPPPPRRRNRRPRAEAALPAPPLSPRRSRSRRAASAADVDANSIDDSVKYAGIGPRVRRRARHTPTDQNWFKATPSKD